MNRQTLFIGLIPPEPIQDQVNTFKTYASTHFDTRRALHSPPHITLYPPFKAGTEDLEKIESLLSQFARETDPFPVLLKGFAAFPPRVIFVDLPGNNELIAFQDNLHHYLVKQVKLADRYSEQPFHPHMTVAFKDLAESTFPVAWEWFSKQEFQETFIAKSMALLIHENRFWRILNEYPFKSDQKIKF